MIIQRRSFLAGLGALIAAPAIVRASSLMPVAPTEIIRAPSYLTTHQITREAVALFRNSNAFLQAIDRQCDESFAVDGAKIGTVLRIRLPADFVLTDGPRLSLSPPKPLPELSAPEMAAVGAAAVLAKNPIMSRRFWGGR